MGKKILITGGNRGIGKGLVAGLCENNYVFFSVRDEKKGLETLNVLPKVNTKFIVMDVCCRGKDQNLPYS